MSSHLIPPGVSSVLGSIGSTLKSVLDPVTVTHHTVTNYYDGDTVVATPVRGTRLNPPRKPKVSKPKTKVVKRKLQPPRPVARAQAGAFRLRNGTIIHPGDQISYRFGGVLDHHAIFVGDVPTGPTGELYPAGVNFRDTGVPAIVQISNNGRGIELVPINTTSSRNWTLVGRSTAGTVPRAFAALGQAQYNVMWRNCETIANSIRSGIPLSYQVLRMAGGAVMFVGAAIAAALRGRSGSKPPGQIPQPGTPVPELPSLAEDLLPTLKMRRRGLPERRRQVHPLISLRRRTGPDVFDPAIASSRKRPRHHLGPLLEDASGVFLLKKKRGFEIV
jgi:hypothetical protein